MFPSFGLVSWTVFSLFVSYFVVCVCGDDSSNPWDAYYDHSAPSRPFSEAFVGDPLPASVLWPWIPSQGEYFISDEIPALDVTHLEYSKIDWSRWDSYGPQEALYLPETDWTSATSVSGVDSNLVSQYLAVFSHVLDSQFYQTGYSYFRGFSVTNFDIYANLINNNDFNPENFCNNVSYAINQAYNVWRNAQKAAMASTDTESIDVTTLPDVADTLSWMEMYLGTELSVQLLTHATIPRGAPWGPYDQFGLFANQNSLGSGISASAVVFEVAPLGQTFAHYVHLFSTTFLRKSRIAFMASYTALYQALLVGGIGAQLSTAQWVTRLAGASTHVTMILQTERWLRAKGAWSDSIDLVSVSNITNGQWTNNDALTYLNQLLDILVNTTQTYGFTEFNSEYYNYHMDNFALALLHAPNQEVYDKWDLVYRMWWWDVAANYHPECGVWTGAIGRTYDFWSGEHGGIDRQLVRQYVLPLFQGYCTFTDSVTGVFYNACKSNAPAAQPPSGDFALGPEQFTWAAANAAGYGYVPLDVLTSITINMPIRTVEQRFDVVVGQERMNFITPGYSMAHSGDEYGFTSNNVIATARIAGQPNAAYPVNSNTQATNAVNFMRLWLDNRDSPFNPNNAQLIPRLYCSQYQSFILLTSLAVPGINQYSDPPDNGTAPLATNLILPLAVDALYADGVPLPRTQGAAMILPKNTIITIRHGGYSIVVRLLYADRSPTSPIQDAAQIETYTGPAASIAPGAGVTPYSFMWIVDSLGWTQGGGRIVVAHKHGNGVDISAMGPFRVSWLWGAGATPTDTEMNALQNVMRNAALTMSVTATPYAQERVDILGDHVPSWQWNTTVNIAGSKTLSLDRLDMNQTWGFDSIWGVQGGRGLYPWYTNFSRRVDGVEILQWAAGENAFRVTDESANLYQPHINGGGATPPTSPTSPTSPATPASTPSVSSTGNAGPTTTTVPSSTAAAQPPSVIAATSAPPASSPPPSTPASTPTAVSSTGTSSATTYISSTASPYTNASTPPSSPAPPSSSTPSTPPISSNPSNPPSSSTPSTITGGSSNVTMTITFPVPGRVESELFANWYDTTLENLGRGVVPNRGLYDASSVDITYSTAASYGFYISFIDDNEWLEYPLSVATPQTFTIYARFAQIYPLPKTIEFLIDGVLVCTITTRPTSGWENFQMATCNTAKATKAGVHILRIHFPVREVNLDYSHFSTLRIASSAAETDLLIPVSSNDNSTSVSNGPNFSALQANLHFMMPLNLTQNDVFASKLEAQLAQTLGFGSDGTDRIELLGITPDDAHSGDNSLSNDNADDSSSGDGDGATSPTSRRLLQSALLFDEQLPMSSDGFTVSLLILPPTIPSSSSSSSSTALSSVSSALSSLCTSPLLFSQFQSAGYPLSTFDCSVPPVVSQTQAQICVDGSVAETGSCSIQWTTNPSDPSVTALTPSPYSSGSDGNSSSGSSQFGSLSKMGWILVGVAIFCSLMVIAYGVFQFVKGKNAFHTHRRRASFDSSAKGLQLTEVDAGLFNYTRSSDPEVTTRA